MIHVVVPYFRAEKWLRNCLFAMTQRQATDLVEYSIINMDFQEHGAHRVADDFPQVSVIDYEIDGVGGQVLPEALKFGTCLKADSDITVTVDPDAIVLQKGWDAYLLGLIACDIQVAGINPRSGTEHFRRTPEWNWMAFYTRWWMDCCGTFDPGPARVHDIGHVLAARCDAVNRFTWPHMDNPYEGKAATICQDQCGRPFVFHAFYSSRKHRDRIPDGEASGILTDEQERDAIAYCLRGI